MMSTSHITKQRPTTQFGSARFTPHRRRVRLRHPHRQCWGGGRMCSTTDCAEAPLSVVLGGSHAQRRRRHLHGFRHVQADVEVERPVAATKFGGEFQDVDASEFGLGSIESRAIGCVFRPTKCEMDSPDLSLRSTKFGLCSTGFQSLPTTCGWLPPNLG